MQHNPRRRHWLRLAAMAGAGTVWPLPAWSEPGRGIESYVHDVLERLGGSKPETLSVLAPEGSEANLAPMLAAFTDYTSIATELTQTPVDDINSQLLLSHLTQSTRYDVAVVATFGIPDLADARAILPIDRYERRFPAGQRWREASLFARGDTFDGATYGPQVDGDLYVMFYNNALLQDPALAERHTRILGRPLTLPRTWAELDDLMRVAHQPDKGINGGLLYRTPRYIAWEYWARLHAQGLLPFTPDMHPAINTPAAVDVLVRMLTASAWLHPASNRLSLFQNWAAFTEGNTLCNIGWGGSQKHFCKNEAAFPAGVSVTQLPGRVDGEQTVALPYFNWGWNLAVPATSAAPELAYLFGVIATTPNVSTAAVRPRDGFFDPFQPAHYKDDAIIAAYGRDFLEVHQRGLAGAIPDLYIRGQGQYLETLSQQLVAANRQQVSPQRALEKVAHQWESITHRLGRKAQAAQWQQLLAGYPPAWQPT